MKRVTLDAIRSAMTSCVARQIDARLGAVVSELRDILLSTAAAPPYGIGDAALREFGERAQRDADAFCDDLVQKTCSRLAAESKTTVVMTADVVAQCNSLALEGAIAEQRRTLAMALEVVAAIRAAAHAPPYGVHFLRDMREAIQSGDVTIT